MDLGSVSGWLARLATLLLGCVLFTLPGQAAASDANKTGFSCSAASQIGESIEAVASDPRRWDCAERPHIGLAPERTLLRFDLKGGAEQPRYLVSRRHALERVHLYAVTATGQSAATSYTMEELRPSLEGGMFLAPLPPTGSELQSVIVAIDRPTNPSTLQMAFLADKDPGDTPHGHFLTLLLAAACGMLLMPLVVNFAFWRVLREPFLMWHAAITVNLLLTVLLTSSLAYYLTHMSVRAVNGSVTLTMGMTAAAASMFAYHFIEPDKLSPRLRRLLPVCAYWALAVSLLHAMFPNVARPIQTPIYYLAYAPVLALFMMVLFNALRRGSRAAAFQCIGWTPILLNGLIRQFSLFMPSLVQTDAMGLFYLGCVFEVMATTLGVADRFMTIKHQRDNARLEARMMENLSERDALTGLLNRRVISERFEDLRANGYCTFALLDLDQFKSINDDYGHKIGDEVLKATAEALSSDGDSLAIRLGGEEFVLLLRGNNSLQRAEQFRQAIPARVASQVTGLDRLVTASMGVVEAPYDSMPNACFEDLYSQADHLLYEAKAAGRNRTVNVRMQGFHQQDRRQKARRKSQVA